MAVIIDQYQLEYKQPEIRNSFSFGTGQASAKQAQSFKPTIEAPLAEIWLKITYDNTPTDEVALDIYTDDNGQPGELFQSSINLVPAQEIIDLNLTNNESDNEEAAIKFFFDHGLNLTPEQTYWMVLRRTGVYDSDNYYLAIGRSELYTGPFYNANESGYIRGKCLIYNELTDTWAENDLTTENDFWFKEFYQHSLRKNFIYRIFNAGTYVATWTKEVLSEPNFRMTINGGAGEVIVLLGRPFDDFGEDVDVKLNNKVEIWVSDKESPSGRLLYVGYISGYKPSIHQDTEEVEVTLLSYITELQRMVLRDASGNTTLSYSSYDPANILKDVIDKYRAVGGNINYTPSSIQATNTTVTYEFNTNTIKECIDKIIELCPVGWYWRVDPDNTIYLQPNNVLADHSFALGLQIESLETFRRIEDIVNRVLFVGGGSPALFRKYENTGSQGTYGMYEKKIVDQRVTVAATAQIIAEREINSKKDPEIRSRFTIVDSNGPTNKGYDIESVKVGQSLKVRNLRAGVATQTLWDVGFWDIDVWDQTLATSAADVIQIQSVQYSPDSIIIEASSRLPQIAKRIEDIQRNLEVTQMTENPAAPS